VATEFTVIIPARYGASRFPGKPLADLLGRPMLEHVHERAVESGAARVLVATDDHRIAERAQAFGADVIMTRADHPSGTDRIAEALEHAQLPDSAVVVNLQGDEPLLPPALIRQVAEDLTMRSQADIATLAAPIVEPREVFDPNVVKVVRDHQGYALYFSRAPIPWDRQRFANTPPGQLGVGYLRHLGLYAYRGDFRRRYPSLESVEAEAAESLEQLRALWHGARIHVAIANELPPAGVDTPADLERAAEYLRAQHGA